MSSDDRVEVISKLPEGVTCLACAHAVRCSAFGFTNSLDNTFCSFAPSRYQPRVAIIPVVVA